ncbi:IS5 transposase and trans-activator [Escherichia coli]|uniref:IS5 transposase and trans-activator n=1 Tax=Escherichia coli TaxID=562 RepID=A0A376U8Z5_ECOLX|nr:IS5 transposase and trans-activator [Escherichia coli]
MAKHGGSHRAVLPQAGNGRRPYPLETMLRIHCMQHWYNLSDGAMEDALYGNRLHASVCPYIPG